MLRHVEPQNINGDIWEGLQKGIKDIRALTTDFLDWRGKNVICYPESEGLPSSHSEEA